MPKAVALARKGDIDYTYEIVPDAFSRRPLGTNGGTASDRAASTCIMRSSIFGRLIRNGLRSAPVGVPFTADTLTDEQGRRDAHWTDSDILLVYAPGSSPEIWSSGMAKLIPAGSDLVIQMHYMAMGRRRQRPPRHWPGIREAAAAATRADAAADQRPLRDSSPRGRLSRRGTRIAAERCNASRHFSRTCTGAERDSNTT